MKKIWIKWEKLFNLLEIFSLNSARHRCLSTPHSQMTTTVQPCIYIGRIRNSIYIKSFYLILKNIIKIICCWNIIWSIFHVGFQWPRCHRVYSNTVDSVFGVQGNRGRRTQVDIIIKSVSCKLKSKYIFSVFPQCWINFAFIRR